MACADVETAKAKTTPINLTILSSYVNLQEAFLEACGSGETSRLWRKARVARRALQHSCYEPRPTKRKWGDVPTFSGANPVLLAEKRSVSSGDVARDLHPRRFDRLGSKPPVSGVRSGCKRRKADPSIGRAWRLCVAAFLLRRWGLRYGLSSPVRWHTGNGRAF